MYHKQLGNLVIEMSWRWKVQRKHLDIFSDLLHNILSIMSKHPVLPGDGAITPENVDLCFIQQESRETVLNPYTEILSLKHLKLREKSTHTVLSTEFASVLEAS